MSSNTSDTRNWIEQLSSKIPGYSGYVDREPGAISISFTASIWRTGSAGSRRR